MADFMTERRRDCAGMMGSVDEDHELAFLADVGTAVESAQREAGAGAIRLGTQLEFARTEQFRQVTEELLVALKVREAAVIRDVLFDVFLNDLRQLLRERPGRKPGDVGVVGGENLFEVGKLIEYSGSQGAEWDLDFVEQPGNEVINFASCQRVRFPWRHAAGDRWRNESCTHCKYYSIERQQGWTIRRSILSD